MSNRISSSFSFSASTGRAWRFCISVICLVFRFSAVSWRCIGLLSSKLSPFCARFGSHLLSARDSAFTAVSGSGEKDREREGEAWEWDPLDLQMCWNVVPAFEPLTEFHDCQEVVGQVLEGNNGYQAREDEFARLEESGDGFSLSDGAEEVEEEKQQEDEEDFNEEKGEYKESKHHLDVAERDEEEIVREDENRRENGKAEEANVFENDFLNEERVFEYIAAIRSLSEAASASIGNERWDADTSINDVLQVEEFSEEHVESDEPCNFQQEIIPQKAFTNALSNNEKEPELSYEEPELYHEGEPKSCHEEKAEPNEEDETQKNLEDEMELNQEENSEPYDVEVMELNHEEKSGLDHEQEMKVKPYDVEVMELNHEEKSGLDHEQEMNVNHEVESMLNCQVEPDAHREEERKPHREEETELNQEKETEQCPDETDSSDAMQGKEYDDYYDEEDDEEHEFFIQKLKSEIRRLRGPNLSVIPEECESDLAESSGCDGEGIKTQRVRVDPPLVRIVEHPEEPLEIFYDRYSERMRAFDVLNYKQMYSLGILQMKNNSIKVPAKSSGMVSKLRRHVLNKTEVSDSSAETARRLHEDLETVYVGQACLSWEALHWQYRKVRETALAGADQQVYSAQVADQFQYFQVLVERFLEDEQFEGPRILNYVKTRCVQRKLLQVPCIAGTSKAETFLITAGKMVEILEKSVLLFSDFIEADKQKANNGQSQVMNFLCSGPAVEDKDDFALFHSIKRSLHYKKARVHDLQKRGKCLMKKLDPNVRGEGLEIQMALVDLRLVSRVLKMPRITTDQLQWCEKKLSKITVKRSKVTRAGCTVLFPF